MSVGGPFYTEDHESFRRVLRSFVEAEITPNIERWEEAGQLPRELHRKAAAVGTFGEGFPESYGGWGTDDALLRVLIGQEVARCGAGGVNASLLTSYIALPPILQGGTDDLKERVLPRFCEVRGSLLWQSPNLPVDPTWLRSARKRLAMVTTSWSTAPRCSSRQE